MGIAEAMDNPQEVDGSVMELSTDPKERFPNGFDDWAETHYNIAVAIENASENETTPAALKLRTYGTGGLWEMATDLTTEFELTHRDTDWAEENWHDTLDDFIKLKVYGDK